MAIKSKSIRFSKASKLVLDSKNGDTMIGCLSKTIDIDNMSFIEFILCMRESIIEMENEAKKTEGFINFVSGPRIRGFIDFRVDCFSEADAYVFFTSSIGYDSREGHIRVYFLRKKNDKD